MLADELASDSRASRGIVRALAEDDIDVAWPILLRSNSLEDTDLIEIAIKGSIRHRLAIAQRELVEEVVSAAVMAFGEPEVAKSLLANAGARISERTFVRMAELAKEWGDMQPSLAARPDLPAAIALEMLEWAIDGVHEKDFAKIDEVIRLLAYERETWVMAMEKVAADKGVASPAASAPADAAGKVEPKPNLSNLAA
jgi:uncharacterized protein (DUF2336 family)